MKHVVIGASGYLGAYLLNELVDEDVIATARVVPNLNKKNEHWLPLDISDTCSIDHFFESLTESEDGYMFYFLAALHHPDKVEEDWQSAWAVNVVGLAYFLQQIPNNSDLIYSSTDNVYGESINFNSFSEEDITAPVNEYGKQKLVAEQLVLAKNYNVARYSFLIGPSKTSKPHFYDFICDSWLKSKEITLLNDSFRSAISFSQASLYTVQLAKKYYRQPFGLINISSDEALSKLDVGAAIIGQDVSKVFSPISFNEQSFFVAKRPQNVLLNNSKLKQLLNISQIKFEV